MLEIHDIRLPEGTRPADPLSRPTARLPQKRSPPEAARILPATVSAHIHLLNYKKTNKN